MNRGPIMPDATLKEILQLCLSVENSIVEIYRSISVQAGSDEYRTFWEDISNPVKKYEMTKVTGMK